MRSAMKQRAAKHTTQHQRPKKVVAKKTPTKSKRVVKTVAKRSISFVPEDVPPPPIPNYTPPPPIPHPLGSFKHHKITAERDGFEVGGHRRLTNVVRGSWTERPVLNYNIVSHLGREPEEIDSLPDGARLLVEPSQFSPVDYAAVPTIEDLSHKRPDPYLHHNELLRIKAAMSAAPNVDEDAKQSIDRWMVEFRSHIWQPTVQSYQTQQSRARMRLIDHYGLSYGKGGRKSSTAYCTLKPGTGLMFVNGRPYTDYFPIPEHRSQLGMPFYMTGTVSQFDVFIKVKGGGNTAQAEASRLSIANALQNFEPQFRPTLKVNNLLKRDARTVERKHAGHKKARKSFTWVKR